MKKLLIFLISILAFYSCEKDLKSIQLDKNEITIHYDESYQLNVSFSPTDVDIPPIFTWFSENTKVAEVDQNGFVEGVKIGETDITVQTEGAKFQAVCKIIIEPISNLYIEPIYEFGKSKSYIKDKETRELLNEVTDGLIYEGENKNVDYAMYLFKFNKLTGSAILLADKTSVLEEANTFLDERYDLIGTLETSILYRIDSKTVAALSVDNELGLLVLYIEDSNTKSVNSLLKSVNDKIEQLRKLKL